MKKQTYSAQGYCINCGYENYPQWGEYKIGLRIEDLPCPNCGCMTWRSDDRDHNPASVNNNHAY